MDAINKREEAYYQALAEALTPATSAAELKGKFQPGMPCRFCKRRISDFELKCNCTAKRRGKNV